eukprot:g1197.t1
MRTMETCSSLRRRLRSASSPEDFTAALRQQPDSWPLVVDVVVAAGPQRPDARILAAILQDDEISAIAKHSLVTSAFRVSWSRGGLLPLDLLSQVSWISPGPLALEVCVQTREWLECLTDDAAWLQAASLLLATSMSCLATLCQPSAQDPADARGHATRIGLVRLCSDVFGEMRHAGDQPGGDDAAWIAAVHCGPFLAWRCLAADCDVERDEALRGLHSMVQYAADNAEGRPSDAFVVLGAAHLPSLLVLHQMDDDISMNNVMDLGGQGSQKELRSDRPTPSQTPGGIPAEDSAPDAAVASLARRILDTSSEFLGSKMARDLFQQRPVSKELGRVSMISQPGAAQPLAVC